MISLKPYPFPEKNSSDTPVEKPSNSEIFNLVFHIKEADGFNPITLSTEEINILLRKKGYPENVYPVDIRLFINSITDEDIELIKSRRV